jgi:hypothetical protein
MDEKLKQKLVSFFKKYDSYEYRRTLSNNGLSPSETMQLLSLLGIDYEKDVSSYHRNLRGEQTK